MKISVGTLFAIKDWDTLFENAASRKLKGLGWVPIPNGHDSLAYCRMMARKDGPEIFAAWILIVQLASRCADRGTLASSDGRPYCPEEMAVKTRAPERIFTLALPYLCEAGWIEASPPLGKSASIPGESASRSAGSGGLTGGNRREGKGKGKETPNPLEGVSFPDNLISNRFKIAWDEWMVHRAEIKKPLKPTQISKQLKRLSELGEAAAITALDHTIQNGWQGIRQPEEPTGQPTPKGLNNNTPNALLRELQQETERL